MIKRLAGYFNYFHYFIAMARINMALSRAAATSALRQIDETNPQTWEFCGFSQSGGDGIIDFLTRKILRPNRYFVEIGSNDGIENNSAWLAFARRFTGLLVDGDARLMKRVKYLWGPLCLADYLNIFVDKDNAIQVREKSLYADPDFFSIDIDGNDYYVAETLLKAGLRPKIFVAEYNSSFGPEKSIAAEHRPDFYGERERGEHPVNYWGCSLKGWQTLLGKYGYRFLTVDANGVDAFFIRPEEFDPAFVGGLKPGLAWKENYSTVWSFRTSWEKQFELIKDKPFLEIK